MPARGLAYTPRLCLCLLLAASVSTLSAAEPTLRSINIRGLQIGGTTTLIIDGDDLGTVPQLLLPFAAKQERDPKSTDKRATFNVTLDKNIVPGLYHLRLATDQGVSMPVLIGVDTLPQRVLAPTPETLPVALHGTTSGSTAVEAKFQGKAGQKVLVEVEAQRLGGKLRPVVHVYNPRGLQLGWAWATPARAGDTRLEVTLTEDGVHTATVHDVEYAGQAPGHFRLKLGQWSSIDQAFPPLIARGQPASVELLGPTPAPRVDIPASANREPIPLAWPKDGSWSGLRPYVRVSPHAEVLEQPAVAGKPQELPGVPVGVSGRLSVPYEEDIYKLPVKPGMKLRLEVFAERLGASLDAAVVVRNEAGAQLARGEDSPGTLDPVLEYTVPAKTTAVLVGVVDAQGRGSPQGIYRLSITTGPKMPGEGFSLSTPLQRLLLPPGGKAVLPVLVDRRGYEGKVDISALDLPAGVTLEGTSIADDADGTLITVVRSAAAIAPTISRLRAKGGDEEQPIVVKNHPLERLQPWLAQEIAIAGTTTKVPTFQVAWRDATIDAGLVPSKKSSLPLKVVRPDENTVVRFTLLTSQNPPLANNQPDPNQTIRVEKATEIAAKIADVDVPVLVPPLINGPSYDVSVQAELLSADKKTVLATAYAPVKRLPLRTMIALKLDGPTRIESVHDVTKGSTIKLQGKLERREGLTGDVVIALTGLPPGIAVPAAVTVKAADTAFVMNVVIPANVEPGELHGLKLNGSGVADAKQPNIRVRSRDVDITLVLKAP